MFAQTMKDRIKNDKDWYLASICMRCEELGRNPSHVKARATTWLNTHLVHARSPQEAYRKAVAIGQAGAYRYKAVCGPMKWRFVGIWELLPVYDDLGDGEEIFWTDYGMMTAGKARQLCLNRSEAVRQADRNIPVKDKQLRVANNTSDRTAHPGRVRSRSR